MLLYFRQGGGSSSRGVLSIELPPGIPPRVLYIYILPSYAALLVQYYTACYAMNTGRYHRAALPSVVLLVPTTISMASHHYTRSHRRKSISYHRFKLPRSPPWKRGNWFSFPKQLKSLVHEDLSNDTSSCNAFMVFTCSHSSLRICRTARYGGPHENTHVTVTNKHYCTSATSQIRPGQPRGGGGRREFRRNAYQAKATRNVQENKTGSPATYLCLRAIDNPVRHVPTMITLAQQEKIKKMPNPHNLCFKTPFIVFLKNRTGNKK